MNNEDIVLVEQSPYKFQIKYFQLNKWLLLPFIFMDIFRLTCALGLFCITLIAIKAEINLGALIAISVCGTFLLSKLFSIIHRFGGIIYFINFHLNFSFLGLPLVMRI